MYEWKSRLNGFQHGFERSDHEDMPLLRYIHFGVRENSDSVYLEKEDQYDGAYSHRNYKSIILVKHND